MKIMKKLIALLLSVIIITAPVNSYAGSIEGSDVDEKAMEAGFNLYGTIAILVENYIGGDITVEQLYEAALRGIAEELDEYSFPMTEEEYWSYEDDVSGNYEGIGIALSNANSEFTYVKEVMPDSPAEKAGVLSGDIIMKVNGADSSRMAPDEITEMMMVSPSKTVNLELKRGDQTISATMEKAPLHKTVFTFKIEELLPSVPAEDCANIRYVALISFGEKTYDEFKACIEKLSKENVEYIILDLRDNSGGYLSAAEDIGKLIVPEGPIYYMTTKSGEKQTVNSTLTKAPFKHIVVLTNYYTASASELLASALQDSKAATVIGQRTYGKGVVQYVLDTITGGIFKFTGAEYLRRSGGKVNKVGVAPDIFIDKPGYIESFAVTEADAAKIVTDVKKVMSYLGYDVDDLPVYSEKLKQEIIKFQNEYELNPTGLPDKDTVMALNIALYMMYLEDDLEVEVAYKYIKEKFAQ